MLRAPYLRATLFVVGLGFLIQITGINAVVFYSPMIFKEMGFTGNASLLLLPALVQVGSLVATLVSLSIVDRLGRRPTLLTGIGAMIASTLLLVVVFAAGDLTGTTGWLGFVGIFVFTAGFNFGFGSLVWVYASESFPSRLRSIGRVGDADRRPRGEPDHRALLPQRARVAGRDRDLRDVRGAGGDRLRVRVVAGARDEGPAARGHPRATGRTAAAGPRGSGRRRSASPARRGASGSSPASRRMPERRADVLIVGGGLGGIAAAASARALDVVMSEPTTGSTASSRARRYRRTSIRGSSGSGAPRPTARCGTASARTTATSRSPRRHGRRRS